MSKMKHLSKFGKLLLIIFHFSQHLIPIVHGKPCDFTPQDVWGLCDCQPVQLKARKVFCRHVSWIHIPVLPKKEEGGGSDITSLSIIQSGLIFIEQDSFKGQNIQILDLSHNQISTVNVNAFRGLQRGLIQLSLNHNSLQSIPSESFTYLYQLQHLYLRNNHISTIPLSTFQGKQLENLAFLYLDDNLVSKLYAGAFGKLKLQLLTMGNNRLVQIHENSLPDSLRYLILKNNALETIPLQAMKEMRNLMFLNLDGNDISKITRDMDKTVLFTTEMDVLLSNNKIRHIEPGGFGNFQRLKTLDLSYNQLEELHERFLEKVEQVQKLDLSYNQLSDIPEKAFINVYRSLKELVVEENAFHALPQALRSLTRLEKLNLNSNKLTSLSTSVLEKFKPTLKELKLSFNSLQKVPTSALEGMTKLNFLDLSKNQISYLPGLAFGTLDGQGTTLYRLNLAGNNIRKITESGTFLYMTVLAYLDLSYNKIEKLSGEAMSRLGGLESLFLQNNQLIDFPTDALRQLTKLRYLILDDNKIMVIPTLALQGLNQLEQLSIQRNRIYAVTDETFPSDILKHLKMLNLRQNHIVHLSPKAFHNLSSLQMLNLGGNNIPSINGYAFSHLPSISMIDLSRNRINTTYQSAFFSLPRLHTLILSHNRLNRIEDGTFKNVDELEKLDLSFNLFETFNPSFLRNTKSLRVINLNNNQLTSVDLSRLRHSIQRVNLRDNKFQEVNIDLVSGFTDLHTLDLSSNGIMDIDRKAFLDTVKLTNLRLSKNYLNDIRNGTFMSQKAFRLIDLSWNQIKKLSTGTFGEDNVYQLDVSHNQLRSIPYNALNSIRNSLSHLDLSFNRIRTLEAKFFTGLGNMSTMILSNNLINNIDEASFRALHKLRHLDLSHNPVTSWHPMVFRGLSHSIQLINLAATGLFSLPKISQRNIHNLNLSFNKISKLTKNDLTPLSKLQTLDLSHNQLDNLDADVMGAVKDLLHLNLSFNPFTAISADLPTSLHKLQSLRIHDLPSLRSIPTNITFHYLRHLREFYFYNVQGIKRSQSVNLPAILGSLPPLRSLHIEILDNSGVLGDQLQQADSRFLRDIMITGAHLKEIKISAFKFLRGFFVRLQISRTKITEFPGGALQTMSRVNYLDLDLSQNRLRTLEPFRYSEAPIVNVHGTILVNLNLNENPLICDCKLWWLKPWFEFLERDLQPDVLENRRRAWATTICYEPADMSRSRKVPKLNFARIGCVGIGARAHVNWLSLLLIHLVLFVLGLANISLDDQESTEPWNQA